MALRLDISDCSVLVLCDDCPPWWQLTDNTIAAERLALAHIWAVHEGPHAARLASTMSRRQQRRRALLQ